MTSSVDTPTIQTARLLLRPFALDDAADVFAYASNPNVARFTTWSPHRTIADSEAFLHTVLATGPDEHTWAICSIEDGRASGAIEFGLVGDTEAELHYVLAEPLWNRGLMTEAARVVLAWGLDAYPQLTRVSSCAVVENVASHRVMQHCGMVFERVREDQWAKSATPVHQVEYALTPSRGIPSP